MATPVWAPGYVGKSSFFIAGGGFSYVDINILDWDWQEEVMDLVTTHSGSGGIAERIAGVLDGRGAVHANYDIANQFHKGGAATLPGVISGVKGMLKNFVSATLFFAIPIMIQSIPIKSAVLGKVEFTFNFLLSGDAGTYARPL